MFVPSAPSAPVSLGYTHITPSSSHGPRIHLTWSKPAEPNGVIRDYTLSYSHSGNPQKEISGIDVLSYTVNVLGGVQYQFYIRAVTIKPGSNAPLTVDIPVYSKFRVLFGIWFFTFSITLATLSVYVYILT